MSKIYAVIMLTAVALTASASFQRSALQSGPLNAGAPLKYEIKKGDTSVREQFSCVKAFAGEAVEDADETPKVDAEKLIDVGYWDYVSVLEGRFTNEVELSDYNSETGDVSVILMDYYVLTGKIDTEKGTLTISQQNVGKDPEGFDVYFYLKTVDDEGYIIDGPAPQTASVGVIDGNVITFPMRDIWAIGYPDNEKRGYYVVTYSNVFTMGPVDPNKGWRDLGDAEFVDGWVLPAFGINQFDNAYMVPLQQNEQNENIYRLVDPYHGNFPLPEGNTCTRTGYIQFDVTDPDIVIVTCGIDGGFANREAGVEYFYPSNFIGAQQAIFLASYGFLLSPSDLLSIYDQRGVEVPCTTFKDGVVTFGSVIGVSEEGDFILYDCSFGVNDKPLLATCWADQSGNVPNMCARITFPEALKGAVNTVSGSDNAPVEYYNMQGLRILRPEAGQILVRRQGDKTVKEIIRK